MPPFEDPTITKSIRSVFFGRNPLDEAYHFSQNLTPSHRNYLTSLGLVGSNPQTNIDQETAAEDVEDEVIELYDMLARLIPMLEKLYRYAANPNPEIGAAENQEEGGAVGNHENVAVQTKADGAMHNQEEGTVHNEEDGALHNQEDGDVGNQEEDGEVHNKVVRNQEEDGEVHNKEAVRNQEEDGAVHNKEEAGAIHNEGDEAVGNQEDGAVQKQEDGAVQNQEDEAVGNQEDVAVEDEQVAWLLDLNQFPNLQRHSKLTKREKRGEFTKP